MILTFVFPKDVFRTLSNIFVGAFPLLVVKYFRKNTQPQMFERSYLVCQNLKYFDTKQLGMQ